MIIVAAAVLGAALLLAAMRDRRLLVFGLTATVVTNASAVVETEYGVQGYVLPLALLTLGLVGWERFVSNPPTRRLVSEPRSNALVLTGAGLVATVALSAAIGPFVGDHPETSSFYVGLLAKDLLIVAAIALAVSSPEHLRAGLYGLVVGGAVLGAGTVVQMLVGLRTTSLFGFGRWTNQEIAGVGDTARAAGPFLNDPNSYAQHLAVAIGAAIGLAMTSERRSQRRWMLVAAAVVMSAAMVATNSRTGLLAIGLIAAVAMVLQRPSRAQLWIAGGVTAAALAGPFGIWTRLSTLGQISDVAAGSADTSLTGRVSEALAALQMFADHPVTGVGFGAYPVEYLDVARRIGFETRFEERSAHSLPLEIAAEQGLIGVVAWSALAVFVYVVARRVRRSGAVEGLPLTLSLVGFAATAVFLHDVHPRIMWALVALAIGAARVLARPPTAPAIALAGDGPVVAMVIQNYVPALGGAERQLASLMPRFVEAGVRPVVITREHPDRPRFDEVDGVPVFRIPLAGPKPLRSAMFVFEARRLLASIQPDVIHAFDTLTPSTIGLGHRRRYGTPVMTKLLRSGPRGDLAVLERKPGGAARVARLVEEVDTFVSISSDLTDELLTLEVDRGRIAEIPNGVDVDRFVSIAAVARERAADPETRVIATGRLAPEKRLVEVARRWPTVTARDDGARLVLVGDGPDRERLDGFADVTVLGVRDDVPDQLRAASIYVSASDAEGLSNSLLEAMSTGLPCVVTDVGGVRDVITDGVDGIIVPPDDLDRLVDEVADLVDDPRRRRSLGRAARQRVRSGWSLDATAERLVAEYRRLAARSSRHATDVDTDRATDGATDPAGAPDDAGAGRTDDGEPVDADRAPREPVGAR